MITRLNNIVTVTTATNHGLSAGQMVMISDVLGVTAGRWDMVGQILSTPTLNSFTLANAGSDGVGSGGKVTPMTSPANNAVPGPFAFDPDSGYAITGTDTTSTMTIGGMRGISTLTVVSTADFPSSGYLVLGFGTQHEIGPVKYVAILDSTTFIIDRTFVFPDDIPSGVDVSLLYQNTPWVPANATEVGAFWLTDSSSGRVAAENFINDAVAAGVDVNNRIIYPGDRGIGGQGLPIVGVKISDKVEVWAGDDVDQEVAEAHDG